MAKNYVHGCMPEVVQVKFRQLKNRIHLPEPCIECNGSVCVISVAWIIFRGHVWYMHATCVGLFMFRWAQVSNGDHPISTKYSKFLGLEEDK